MSTKFLSPGWRMPRNANQIKSSNYSLDFGGSNQYISSSPTLSGLTDVTVSCWAKFENINNNDFQYVLIAYNTSQSGSYRVGIGMIKSDYSTVSDRYKLYTIDGSNLNISSFVVSQDVWYNIVVTQSGTVRKLFVNGDLISTFTGVPSLNLGNNLEIGRFSNNNHYFPGKINSVSIFDYALSASQVTTLWGGGTSVSNPMALPRTPIAYYPLGTSAWNGNFLAENNAIGDYVFDFDGSDDAINISNNSVFNLGTSFTISGWFNVTSYVSNMGYISFDSSTRGWFLFHQNTNLALYDGTSVTTLNSNLQPTNEWNSYIITYDGTDLIFYLNGQQNSTQSVSINLQTNGNDGQIGNQQFAAGRFYNGSISNVQLFNTALAATDVETLYNYGSPIRTLANIPQNSNLKAWYKLDASEVYNSSTTEWEVNNALSPWTSSLFVDNSTSSSSYIKINNLNSTSGLSEYSFSAWVDLKSVNTAYGGLINAQYTSNWAVLGNASSGGSSWRWDLRTSSGTTQASITAPLLNQGWCHIAGTYDGSNMKFYKNGEEVFTGAKTGTMQAGSFEVDLGFLYGSNDVNSGYSNFSIWSKGLTDIEVEELYNSGNPGNLLSHSAASNLLNWWKLNNLTDGLNDSKGSFNAVVVSDVSDKPGSVSTLNGESLGMSQANLVQSDLQTVAPYSKYALDFDPADTDYIDCGTNSSLDTGDFSVSIWLFRRNGGGNIQYVISNSSASAVAGFDIITFREQVKFDRKTLTKQASTGYQTIGLSYSTWHNIVGTYNDSTGDLKLYLDGVLKTTFSATSDTNSVSSNLNLGRAPSGGGANYLNGKLSNASIWNTALTSAQVTEIYNKGLPSNLNSHSAYSNIISWWQLGENSSFDGNNWIVADEKGANNGTSANMTVANLTNGVGTTANGTSTGMSEGNLVGDAPYSTANALSSGMSVVSRVTGSGNTP